MLIYILFADILFNKKRNQYNYNFKDIIQRVIHDYSNFNISLKSGEKI